MLRLYCPGPLSGPGAIESQQNLGQLRPEMFSGIGALPEPSTAHVVNRGVTVPET